MTKRRYRALEGIPQRSALLIHYAVITHYYVKCAFSRCDHIQSHEVSTFSRDCELLLSADVMKSVLCVIRLMHLTQQAMRTSCLCSIW